MLRIVLGVLRWIGGWIYYISLVCFAGTCLGVLSHLLFALLFVDQLIVWIVFQANNACMGREEDGQVVL